ncbi:MAG TPA: hypothetical protein VHW23_46245 [Kofleriaceae bacterium]|jgi:hypothetical protein|nr:hypothetical protein [Kofleriaceae bacterium]
MRVLPALVICALCGLAVPARADTTATSSIAQLMVLEPGDTSYKLFHGAAWLEHDKAQWNYRWGGLQCKGRELSDTSVQLLFAAFRDGYQVSLEYVISDYKGKPYRCVTGLTISRT